MAQTPPSQQQFCVRWNSHLGSLGAAFPQLLAGQRFVDVTLACEGHQLHCHRLVLAACSAYFESLLSENPCKHPIIIMPHDIKLWEIQALVDFMYKGEVNVSQAGLPDLLKCAEVLQIRGLCGSDAALNLNSIVRTKEYTVPSTVSVQPHLITATVTSASPPCSTTTTSTVSTLASVSANNGNNVNNVQTLPKPSPNEPNSPRETCTSPNIQNSGTASAQNNSIKRSPPVYEPNTSQVIKAAGQPSKFATSTPNNSVAPKVEPVDEMMEEYTDEETIGMSAKGEREESEYLDGSSKQSTEKHLHHPTKTQQHIIENLEEQIDDAYRQENENYKRNMYKNLKSTLMLRPSLLDHDYEEENIFNEDSEDSGSEDNRKNQRQKKSTPTSSTSSMVTRKRLNVSPSEKSSKRLAIASSSASVGSSTLSSSPSRSPDSSVANNNNCCRTTNNNLGKIRVKSNENLYGNYSNIVNTNANALNTMDPTDEEMQLLPPSLKFNKEQMTIFVKKSDIISQGSLAGLQSAKIVAGPMIHAVRSLASTSTSVVSMSGNNVVIRDFVVSNKSADNFIRSGSITCAASVRSVHNVGTETDDHSRITGSGGVQLVSSGSGSSSGSSSIGSPGSSDDNSNRSIGSICDDTPEIGETATIKTETDITEEEQDSNSNYENIVCSPNVNAFHNDDDDDDEEYDEDNSNEQTINAQDGGYDEMPNFDDITLGSNYGGPTANRSLLINQQQMPTSNMPTILIPTLANYNNANTQIAHNSACSSTTGIARIGARPNLLKNTLLLTYNRNSGKIKEVVGQITVSDSAPDLCYQTAEEAGNIGGGVTFSRLDPNAIQHIQQGSLGGSANPPSPSPSAVVLRNPRSNQPRSYSTEALYAALMDVKAGESIYRASQLHKVPRKTLRNWMKRWHIKSAFPMPRQLKQAAEKKRLKQMELKLENYTV